MVWISGEMLSEMRYRLGDYFVDVDVKLAPFPDTINVTIHSYSIKDEDLRRIRDIARKVFGRKIRKMEFGVSAVDDYTVCTIIYITFK